MKDYEETFKQIMKEVSKVVVGQKETVKQMLIALLCDGNVLLEGYPGLAKTLAVKTLAEIMDLKFSRIQSTPDLMPSDITGTYIIEEKGGKRVFKFQAGPLFANLVLADEINRATPKTQSALLEAMQEKQVTMGNTTFKLDLPFFVLATQNPIEQEGTYPLPEAQADRFLLKVKVSYPTEEEEGKIVEMYTSAKKSERPRVILSKEKISQLQYMARQVPIAKEIGAKAIKLVSLTRKSPELIEYGASPRASIALVSTSKAKALIEGRPYVSKDDIKAMAYPVLRHRIILNFEAERKGLTNDDAIKELISKVF